MANTNAKHKETQNTNMNYPPLTQLHPNCITKHTSATTQKTTHTQIIRLNDAKHLAFEIVLEHCVVEAKMQTNARLQQKHKHAK